MRTIDRNPVVKVAVDSLSVVGSPRISGENPDHLQTLAEVNSQLPPILVHYPTMHVIDGVHRLGVARLRGQDQIAARFFYGDEADAFVLAVESNTAHGLPLSLADRKSAAARIIGSHPRWSDRAIASIAGLSARTVSEIRARSGGAPALAEARIGRDGRVRPINGAEGRRVAAELIADNPNLSLRQIARAAGISPETARDVRNRVRRGESPVLDGRPRSRAEVAGKDARRAGFGINSDIAQAQAAWATRSASMRRLCADPALRLTETGRTLLRLLNVNMIEIEEWEKVGENVPPHCGVIVAGLARECSRMWEDLATIVERRMGDIA